MPPYSPEPPEYEPTKIDQKKPKFPPKPLHIPLNPVKDRYSFLAHDPRTLFAGAPSSFLQSMEARIMCRARKEALQIGAQPGDIKYCIDGHVMTKTETVKKDDFFYRLTTTVTPIPTSTRMETNTTQTDEEFDFPRCSKDCQGCGRRFTCQ